MKGYILRTVNLILEIIMLITVVALCIIAVLLENKIMPFRVIENIYGILSVIYTVVLLVTVIIYIGINVFAFSKEGVERCFSTSQDPDNCFNKMDERLRKIGSNKDNGNIRDKVALIKQCYQSGVIESDLRILFERKEFLL